MTISDLEIRVLRQPFFSRVAWFFGDDKRGGNYRVCKCSYSAGRVSWIEFYSGLLCNGITF